MKKSCLGGFKLPMQHDFLTFAEDKMRKISIVALALGAALTLSACSGGEDTSSSTPAAPGDTTSADTAKDEAIAALLPESVASSGKIVFGTDPSYAPAEFLGDDGTTATGYDIDIAKAIAGVLGLTADIQSSSFDAIIPAIGTKYDAGISSFTINPDRLQQVNMIQYFSAGSSFAVPAGNPNGVSADDLCGKIIGVQTSTVQDDDLADRIIPECEAAGKPAPTPLQYDLQTDVTTALLGGKADLMYADSPIIAYAIEQTGDKLEQLGDVFDTAPQGIVVAKDDAALTEAIQNALQKLIDDGTYGDILAQWGVTDSAVETAELNPAS
ncbi:ABC transporter substrate-binding protein [Rarobacter faecitabidus]|uniref:Amino acid ABC transporter substrate-binding protein (PAAT family) n=1 Tax=Rarobacter faecitabidus TaxID=13243 RepID=A0A542ZPB0_RARFA|nr:ABC transporter substrate-binding protein [Rarobacter faecitabidus]TQL62157.1 amino acid ABC transporter substrate-binding protein (PAAT family) [Rarobacter faecitabidus]